ncbi:UDP-glucose 4-epimerase GalE [Chitinivibrio alkaliphilus]|uniref:UDP-glucose 4-epimerase n=1 Tax=Chitinivibrio alkaliphilus ACht1 TaxID=1313304 RepID=U7DB07_9BACT|nr:UDP-glucose 4-epimerase GalE [Chitinivibrio alkaliphilus]ERP38753.1 UDP-glucose 4-epimerase [Chitinivibrio alkaliphilus ACht1]
MKYLIIGGAGYIGSHVTQAFLQAGHEVTVFDNLSSGKRQNLFSEAAFVEADILDYPTLEKTLSQGFDGLIHLAALKAAGESMNEPERYAENNIIGSLNILNAAARTGVSAIVFSSTAAVYGEPTYLPIDENHPQNPMNFYGFTKLEIERLLGWFSRLKGIRYAALRYFNAAGYDPTGTLHGLEEQPENLLPVVMETAAGIREKMAVFGDTYETRDGTCIRDYIHVSDLADAHLRAADYLHQQKEDITVNLGSEEGITVQEMLHSARQVTGQPIPADVVSPRPGDPSVVLASAEQAQKLLGWTAKYSDVDTLIKTTWQAYQKEGVVRT